MTKLKRFYFQAIAKAALAAFCLVFFYSGAELEAAKKTSKKGKTTKTSAKTSKTEKVKPAVSPAKTPENIPDSPATATASVSANVVTNIPAKTGSSTVNLETPQMVGFNSSTTGVLPAETLPQKPADLQQPPPETVNEPKLSSPNDAIVIELNQKLQKAESERDLATESEIIKKLIAMNSATRDQKQRLLSIEHHLRLSKGSVAEKWKTALELFEKEDWGALRVCLNQNPHFSENEKYSLKLLEMSFACDYFLDRIPSENVSEQAKMLLLQNPKSFWGQMIQALEAIKKSNEKEALKYMDLAASVSPKHPTLVLARKTFEQKTKRRIMTAVLILIGITVVGFLFTVFFGFLEMLDMHFIRFLMNKFPARALARLEKKLGVFLEKDERIAHLEMLTEAAFKSKNFPKAERYSLTLLDLSPKNKLATEMLGRHYLQQKSWNARQAETVAGFCLIHSHDKDTLKQFGDYVKESKNIRYSFDVVLKRYLEEFPDDSAMVELLKDAYLGRPSAEFAQETLNLLMRLWEISKSESVFQKICKGYIAAGRFEEEFISRLINKKTDVQVSFNSIFSDVDKELAEEEKLTLERIGKAKGDGRITEMGKLIERGNFSSQGFELIEKVLTEIITEGKSPDRYWAEKARNHVREVGIKCRKFYVAAGIEFETPKKVSDKVPSGIKSEVESKENITPLADRISELPDEVSFDLIQALIKQSSAAEVPVWKTYLERNLPPQTLSTVLKFIGNLKSRLLTPVLIKFLSHQNSRTRANAIEALETNDDSEAINHLMIFINDTDNRIRGNALKALHKWKIPQADKNIKLMAEDSQVPMRDSAVFVLKSIKFPWAQTILKGLLNDPEQLIRKSAISAIAEQNLKGAEEILRNYLKNPVPLEEVECVEKALSTLKAG
ncbi:MAG: HEAT repeat domain-containing protein [Candidatus Riflebacteria bacterium]|nr:HEAT repeat domain-containing protein [Candidatus Riflebacteria bacterium]